ncbi:MAG TPA: DNA polymerase Y family protein [Tepidisphaeraceae bacterium]|nr:DNA polymerase Y family protein [Tepidisphaeraceae bacterium]
MLIVRTVADRQVIVCLSPEASAFGIRVGMTLTQAHALCAHVQHAEHEPLRDSRAMEAMARWLMRFSPVVSLASGISSGTGILPVRGSSGKRKNARNGKLLKHGQDAHTTGGIFLDLTGCDRLFNGLPNLVRQIHHALTHLRITARMAVAPTPGAAWALAEAGKNAAIISQDDLIAALSPLPPAALRLSGDLVAALHHLGICTIGQVIDLPRDLLPARFGKELLHRLDQALGNIAEPLVPLEHHAPVEAKMEFDGPVSSLEAIHAVARHLLQQVIEQLTHRGQGARRLDLELSRAYAEPVKKSILLSHPSREMRSLFNLMVCALEEDSGLRVQDSGKKNKGTQRQRNWPAHPLSSFELNPEPRTPSPLNIHGDGYTAFCLRVPLLQRLSEEQIFLLEQEEHASRLEVDRLIDRLRLRLGESGAVRVELVESHLPERAWGEQVQNEECRMKNEREMPDSPVLHSAIYTLHLPPRPLHLLRSPMELRVIVTPSDAIEGRPAAFVYEHQVHKVMHCAGPERIAGCWWDGHTKTRDYYEVENPAGKRFWIFRVGETARWYLHGSYE